MTTENLAAAGDTQAPCENPWGEDAETLRSADGVKLVLRSARMAGPARADVILVHGLGEHSGRYGQIGRAHV